MKNEYKQSTNLPQTTFPMRGSLAQNEPLRLKRWQEADVYAKARKARADDPTFVLHDGPPYANGPIHLGHALNKISKDFVNRFQLMQKKNIAFIPGWDCHGQPIEHKVEEQLGTKKFRSLPPEKIRELCRSCATQNIDLQKEGFKRLGVLADWDHAYLTLSHEHDAADIEIFKHIYDTGAIYRGKKPVYWCTHCQTALAEAEIEYREIEGPSIYVAFKLDTKPDELKDTQEELYLAIWTTTPWTLPANAAVSMKPDATYVALKDGARAYIVLKDLADELAATLDIELELVGGPDNPIFIPSESLKGLTYQHPIFSDIHPFIMPADFVTTETGTGLVHTAPGHGADDFYAGLEYDLAQVMPVDAAGNFYKGETYGSGGPFSGMNVWEANPKIIAWLKEQNTLLAEKRITHSYPHCWRCKHPVIFRATEQWFVSMDRTGLRQQTLNIIHNDIAWHPSSSVKRIDAMIAGRPDWCISRQRVWGVPIPSFTCKNCGSTVLNDDTLEAVIKLFEKKGSDAWYTEEPASYLKEACVCAECGSHDLTPDKDILDVWWDSGVSHTAVLKRHPDLAFPADLYLEGSDQHRGWFQASLLTSVGAWNEPPFKACVTLGFTLDGEGRKMSKSLGNVIDPNQVASTRGADIIRLWVASVDAMQDMPCNEEILDRVADSYRRFRNTFRFLLGEIEGQFDLERDGVALTELKAYDRLILARATQVHHQVTKAYQEYRFNQVFRLLYDFVVTDLSNGYLNATKDRMYCDGVTSPERRSAQTTWYYLLAMLLSDLQPILAFTTDELMEYVPQALKQGQDFAALLTWWESPLTNYQDYIAEYEALMEIRQAFTKAYEEALTEGIFEEKTPQAASAHITLTPVSKALLHDILPDIAEPLVAASAEVQEGTEMHVSVSAAQGQKCLRCWNWRELNEHQLCERCQAVLDKEAKE